MEHEETQRWLSAFLDGEIGGQRRARVHQHLQQCPLCRQAFDDLRHLRALLLAQPLPTGLEETHLWPALASHLPERPETCRRTKARTGSLDWLLPTVLLLGQAVLHAVGLLGLALMLLILLVGLDWPVLLPLEKLLGAAHSLLRPLTRLPVQPVVGLLPPLPADIGQALGWIGPSLMLLTLSALLTVMYLAWLAAWWTRRAR